MRETFIKRFKKAGVFFNTFRKNRKLIIFLNCLFIATILWFLNALGKSYTTTVSYPVRLINLPKNKFFMDEPPKQLALKVTAHGSTLLRYKMKFSFSPVILNVSDIMDEYDSKDPELFSVNIPDITDKISAHFGSDFQILEIRPQRLSLKFDSLETRAIPVALEMDIGYSPRFDQAGEAQITPAKVNIIGLRNEIETLDTIYTKKEIFRNVKSDIRKEIALVIPKGFSSENDKVLASIPIDEYTEKRFSVPINIRSLPPGTKIRLFPQEAEVSFKIGLRHYNDMNTNNFYLYVNWRDIENGEATLLIKNDTIPPLIKSVKISPSYVEYLIEKD
ncbi:MAG: hypothetical protein FWG22_04035 [Prolixibacteraceae bacterium]|nr:hypothetical protein [Prolixibacteraceae bacterium]